MLKKTVITIILGILFLPFSKSYAASPSFTLYPKGGQVMNKDQGFTVDVLIDSAGQQVASAKFVLLFDPTYLQLTKAERNNSLFKQWPNDESTLDNDNGVVMLSGFTQSGTGSLYLTGSKADILARLTFKVLKEGTTTLDWEFGGKNGAFDTVMYKDGSPPVNILTVKPESASFLIGSGIINPGNVDTAIPINRYIFFTGLVLILFGGFMVFSRPSRFVRKSGTVVVYDSEEK